MAAPSTKDAPGASEGQRPGKGINIESTRKQSGGQIFKLTSKETTHTNGVALERIEPVPAHMFAGAYRPNFLAEWTGEECDKYSFLNCSYFSHSNGVAPTLIQLKQHAQALCNLFKTLTVVDHESDTDDAFDWLDDLDTLYNNLNPSHSLPLNSVRNQLATGQDDATGADVLLAGCSLAEGNGDRRDLATHIEHANQLLEYIDHECAPDGGLFSILPPQGDPARAQVSGTILGQWLVYTTWLVQRVAELESEIANSRDVLAGEATIPMQLTSTARLDPDGKPLLFPQDRYVLANLTPELWDVLNDALARKQHDQEATERAAARALHAPPTKSAPHAVPPLEPVVAVDIPSRAYRIPGSRTIFLVPGHGLHPGTAATREMESSQPSVTTVVRPEIGTRNTAYQRHKDARIEELHAEAQRRGRLIAQLRAQLATATAAQKTAEHELRIARLRAGEARESDRAHLARVVEGRVLGAQQQGQQQQEEGAGNGATQEKGKGVVTGLGQGQGRVLRARGNGGKAEGAAAEAEAGTGARAPEEDLVNMTL